MIQTIVVLLMVCASATCQKRELAIIRRDEDFQSNIDALTKQVALDLKTEFAARFDVAFQQLSKREQAKFNFEFTAVVMENMGDKVKEKFGELRKLDKNDYEKSKAVFREIYNNQTDMFLEIFDSVTGDGGILNARDNTMLERFEKIEIAETDVVLGCPNDYLSQYREEERTSNKPSWGQMMCALTAMLKDYHDNSTMFIDISYHDIMKAIALFKAEAAAHIFTSNKLSGKYLAFPLVIVNKLLLACGAEEVQYKVLTFFEASFVLDEVDYAGVTGAEVLRLAYKRIINYYKKLDTDVYNGLKELVKEEMKPYSLAHLAFISPN